ncbi:hypothetical protein [Nonomuraea sp. B19D2]|uniref:EamA family transporter n=1 Tax=Nonomuraea sp. B19D2 TaxID=3159561 RepID=UPI0032D9BEC9
MSASRQGVLLGVAAYLLWGLSALYWPMVEPTGAVEILALRVLWSPVAVGILVLALGRRRQVAAIVCRPRDLALLALAGVLTSANWALFIWATMNGHVVDASLGYFITPLVSVALGVTIEVASGAMSPAVSRPSRAASSAQISPAPAITPDSSPSPPSTPSSRRGFHQPSVMPQRLWTAGIGPE